jgi:hypothetical protein
MKVACRAAATSGSRRHGEVGLVELLEQHLLGEASARPLVALATQYGAGR